MSPRCLALVLTLSALATAPRDAAGQQATGTAAAPSSSAAARAEALYKEGVRLYTERKWAEAEAVFLQAWALNPTFDVAYNLGNTEFRLGKYREAAEHQAFALHVWPLLAATSGLRGIAEKRLAESRAFVGTLTVKVNVANAEVLMDGKVVGRAPLKIEVFVTPGTPHTVEARLEGYRDAKETVSIEKGASRAIELKLVAASPIDPGPKSALTSDGKAGAGSAASGNGGQASKGGGAAGSSSEGGPNKGLLIAGIASSVVTIGGGVVFAIVSNAKASDDSGDGSQAKPLKTLAAAAEKAGAQGKPVYACAEKLAGSVTLASAIAIYGGLDCGSGWTYVGTSKKSVLAGAVDEVTLTITKTAGGAEVVDFRIEAADGMKEGGSSVAVLADGPTAELVRCELVAGNGAPGAAGGPGDPNGTSAASGAAGNAGKDACSDLDGTPGPDAKVVGGDAVTNDCGGEISVGGSGGEGNVLFGGGGDVGQTGTKGQSGSGEPSIGAWDCDVGGGKIGSSGEEGMPGVGATGPGSITASGYTGTSGGAGISGKAGQGGGGGGGAKGGMICPPGNLSGSGASGGSGGAGGCGGLPGQGGGPGGASIALVSLQASITLTDCTLTAGKGGNGGVGGDLQPGGSGGLAGLGGQGIGGSKASCDGGKGGAGGNGGPGGGGLGGPSLGVAFQGNPPEKQRKTVVLPGSPGAGGPGGSANVTMNAGEAGVSAEEQELP